MTRWEVAVIPRYFKYRYTAHLWVLMLVSGGSGHAATYDGGNENKRG